MFSGMFTCTLELYPCGSRWVLDSHQLHGNTNYMKSQSIEFYGNKLGILGNVELLSRDQMVLVLYFHLAASKQKAVTTK